MKNVNVRPMLECKLRCRFEDLLERALQHPHEIALLASCRRQSEAEVIADMLTAAALNLIVEHRRVRFSDN